MSEPLRAFCPAKVNLYLAVTGRRPDGFHELVSLVAQVNFGDTLELAISGSDGSLDMSCSDASLACDASNLVLRMAEAFRRETGWHSGLRFHLEKRIPTGAGLGGGSSDAAGALRLLEQASGVRLPDERRSALAASIGSDVPLFLERAPCIMRGRGERIERLRPGVAARFAGTHLLVYKPHFPVPTPWAYGQLAAAAPGSYLPAERAEAAVEAMLSGDDWTPGLFNSFEAPVFRKFIAMPELQQRMRAQFGARVLMSGSGSCCFATGIDAARTAEAVELVRSCWGRDVFVETAAIVS